MEVRRKIPKFRAKVYGAISLIVVFVLWYLATKFNWVSKSFLPNPIEVIKSFVPLQNEEMLIGNVLVSFYKVTVGFILAIIVAFPLGIFMGSFPVVKSFINPFLGPLRYLPIAGIVPLFIFWFKIGNLMQIMVLFVGIFVYLLPLVIESVENVSQTYIDTANTLGAKPKNIIWNILVPSSLPTIFEAVRVMNGIGWTYIMLAEIVSIDGFGGIGYLASRAQGRLYNLNYLFAILIIILIIGVLSDFGLRKLNDYLFKWKASYNK
jgi:NitT/TauT family transport system permease protein